MSRFLDFSAKATWRGGLARNLASKSRSDFPRVSLGESSNLEVVFAGETSESNGASPRINDLSCVGQVGENRPAGATLTDGISRRVRPTANHLCVRGGSFAT